MDQSQRQHVLSFLADQREEMEAFLERLVNIDSNSRDPDGVRRVADAIAEFFKARGIDAGTLDTVDAPCVSARIGPRSNSGHVLLLGHMDTVFPTGEVARRPFRKENGRGYGPGVADMKAGLVMNAFVMAAFQETGGAPVPIVALFTADEEIGTPRCRDAIEAHARGARLVLNSEPGRISGNVVSGRRGGAFFRVTVTGKAAHSGLNPEDGRSAIGEMARKIIAWHDLKNDEREISVNVGLVEGGQSVNTVAPGCVADIDLRFTDHAEGERASADIKQIAERCAEGLTGAIETLGAFLPVVQTEHSRKVIDMYLDGARSLGLDIADEFTRSCADSGLTASVGAPTVCAVGPVGAHAHSPEEFVELDSFVPRAQAAALAVLASAADS
ncbi:MAG: M20 family metallopeptidase [Pseudomonadota bacterium]